jgi:hypothetical protein
MGILDDTLSDASRPLPQLTVRRAPADAPEFDSEPPADDGGALTVYRLQKDGGQLPPVAPPALRALDAGSSDAGSLHAPVGYFYDASRQSFISIDGLETGKEPVRTWNSDATDKQERSVSPDFSHRLSYGVSTGSSISSSQVPSPFDYSGKLVQRIDSSDGMRRTTGRGAPSGEPSPLAAAAATPADAGAGRTLASASSETDGRSIEATSAAVHTCPVIPTDSLARPASEPSRESDDAAPGTPLATTATGTGSRRVASDRFTPASPRPQASEQSSARSGNALAATPQLSIGRIDVTVIAPAQPPSRPPAAPNDAFLSKHYLRRL